ncbi:MAG: hypothetical protein DMG69_28100 [Acidobacteria bacterium]|nr:MAG: hypothetical protein DMG69_28100 [Acidobacteriota bacterium]
MKRPFIPRMRRRRWCSALLAGLACATASASGQTGRQPLRFGHDASWKLISTQMVGAIRF